MTHFFHSNTDPKEYRNYDDYRRALDVREQFMDLSQKATDVINASKTDEEMQKGMEVLGFTYHEDETCGRSWCIEKEECLWLAVLMRQEECDENFFGKLLHENDRLIPQEMEERCLSGEGCDALPPAWHQEETRERAVILWFLRAVDAMIFEASDTLPFDEFHRRHPDIDEYMRQVYLCTLHYSLGKPWSGKASGQEIIKKFLLENRLLPKRTSQTLLAAFRKLF